MFRSIRRSPSRGVAIELARLGDRLDSCGQPYTVQDPLPSPAGIDRNQVEAEADRVVDLLELGMRADSRPARASLPIQQ